MRDRLIELLRKMDENATITCPRYSNSANLDTCEGCQYNQEDGSCDYTARDADYLLANGVVVPPCKVGDMVYVIKYCRCNNPECFTQMHCHKKIVKHTPKVYAAIMKLQEGMKLKATWKGNLEKVWQPIGTICYKVIQKPFELKDALDLINSQKAEIEKLERAVSHLEDYANSVADKVKAEAIKEFAERLKETICQENDLYVSCAKNLLSEDFQRGYEEKNDNVIGYIDNLVKEMVGDENA